MNPRHAVLVLLSLVAACSPKPGSANGGDQRTALPVPPEAANAIRAEMRTMLSSLHAILAAPARDTAAMRTAARASGMSAAADPALEQLLPETFLGMGMATHRAFDSLDSAIGRGLPHDSIVARLGTLTADCVTCHATFRLVPAVRS